MQMLNGVTDRGTRVPGGTAGKAKTNQTGVKEEEENYDDLDEMVERTSMSLEGLDLTMDLDIPMPSPRRSLQRAGSFTRPRGVSDGAPSECFPFCIFHPGRQMNSLTPPRSPHLLTKRTITHTRICIRCHTMHSKYQ